ncbi:MAG: 50S ribosomal protein L31 [Candidatus Yanofskybacteria bacterium]|nr:50S ribosomal protein L31 [Candidatus Yanofskybacteria bacterium]
MKQAIHPQYNPKATMKCACGKTWNIGSTAPETNISICANCHPFYTGTEKIVDTRGRVDKFKKRMEKAGPKTPGKKR